MKIKVELWREGFHWLVHFKNTGAMTQGISRKDAIAMACDYLRCLAPSCGVHKIYNIKVYDYKTNRLELVVNNEHVTACFLNKWFKI